MQKLLKSFDRSTESPAIIQPNLNKGLKSQSATLNARGSFQLEKLHGNDLGSNNQKDNARRNEKLVDEIMQMSQQRKGAGPKNQISQIKRSGSRGEGHKIDFIAQEPNTAGENAVKKRDLKRLSKQMVSEMNTSSEDQGNAKQNRKNCSSLSKKKGDKSSAKKIDESFDQPIKDIQDFNDGEESEKAVNFNAFTS